jgi:hypothetical protein
MWSKEIRNLIGPPLTDSLVDLLHEIDEAKRKLKEQFCAKSHIRPIHGRPPHGEGQDCGTAS